MACTPRIRDERKFRALSTLLLKPEVTSSGYMDVVSDVRGDVDSVDDISETKQRKETSRARAKEGKIRFNS